MRNKSQAKLLSCAKKISLKKTQKYILATETANSNASTMLVPRIVAGSLLFANTKTE